MHRNPTFRSGRLVVDYDHVETRGVLAGAYLPRHLESDRGTLTHLVFIGPAPRFEEIRTGCRQPVDNMADMYSSTIAESAKRPRCPTCAKKWEQIPPELRGRDEVKEREPNARRSHGVHGSDYVLHVPYGTRTLCGRVSSKVNCIDLEAKSLADHLRTEGDAICLACREKVDEDQAMSPNGGYYVWVLDAHGNPLLEGPYGPHDLDKAKQLARIGATEGEHDRAVSIGVQPTLPSFEIVRQYKAGSGERVL